MHGPNGLVDALLNNASKLIEVRFYLQYGDYLAESLVRLKNESFNDSFWRKNKLDWVQISTLLEEEEKRLEEWELRPPTDKPDTPVTDDVASAAWQLGLESTDFIWEIHTYAKRNLLAHSNLKHLVDQSDWRSLAERTLKDLASLHQVYPGRGTDQIAMRRTIKNFQNEYFIFVKYIDYQVVYKINDRAKKLEESRVQRLLARENRKGRSIGTDIY